MKLALGRLALALAALGCLGSCSAAETDPTSLPQAAATWERRNAVMLFGGRLSTTDFASTLLFNQSYSGNKPAYDNSMIGVEYERDVLQVAPDLLLRIEAGVDDRFGHYLVCCLIVKPHDPRHFSDPTVLTDGEVHSFEFWDGVKLRWQDFKVGAVRIEFAGTIGLSVVTRTIGRERQRVIDDHGAGHLLGFIAPEIGFSLAQAPRFELTARVMHRSGAGGLFGGVKEGYNANVVGLRYTF